MRTITSCALRAAFAATLVVASSSGAAVTTVKKGVAQSDATSCCSLIPIRQEVARAKAARALAVPSTQLTRRTLYDTDTIYIFFDSAGRRADVDMFSGDVRVMFRPDSDLSRAGGDRKTQVPPLVATDENVRSLVRRNHLRFSSLNTVKRSPARPAGGDLKENTATTWHYEFSEVTTENIVGLNEAFVWINADTNTSNIDGFSLDQREPLGIVPLLPRSKCLEVARWAATRGRPVTISLLLPSEMTPEQRKALYSGSESKVALSEDTMKLREDAWFVRRVVRSFEFNAANVSIDAVTGVIYRSGASPGAFLGSDFSLFKLPQPQVFPKPNWLPVAPTDDGITINFNGRQLLGDAFLGNRVLFLPPIIRDSQPLICAEYLPAFLIKLTRQGKVIYLRGLLPKEGKTARLELGSKHARISGQELELEAAPVEVDGKLYVPASLLQKVNGVLVRWEAKPKTLWVDTRYLRRP